MNSLVRERFLTAEPNFIARTVQEPSEGRVDIRILDGTKSEVAREYLVIVFRSLLDRGELSFR